MSFQKWVEFRPAYDCIEVQPCVHGSDRCKPGEGGSHGRCCVLMGLYLRGTKGAVEFLVFTGWDHPATPEYKHSAPMGGYLTVHSRRPLYEDHEANYTCKLLDDPCFANISATAGEPAFEILRTKGSEGIWQHMEDIYRREFGGVE